MDNRGSSLIDIVLTDPSEETVTITKKFAPRKSLGLTVAATLAFSSLALAPAQAITDCPDGWSIDYWVTPIACDYYIQGDGNFTVPAGVTSIAVMAIGGGGAGGAGGASGSGVGRLERAGGGGGGAEISQTLLTVTPGDVLTADIGLGGAQATLDTVSGVAGNGGDGATTTLVNSSNTVLISAVGGKGGKSGTNGGNGGASGNSNPALIHAGGIGYNSLGASSGGGGGGQWSAGNDGALNVGGSAGLGGDILGLNGLPSPVTSSQGFFRDTTLYPGYDPAYEWIAGAGLGGGGGTWQNDGDGCEPNQGGKGSIATQHDNQGQVTQASCKSSGGYNWIATNSYAGGYPGQGGSGGVGIDGDGNVSSADQGTIGVDGLIWFRIFLEEAPPPPPPTEPTFLDSDSDSLNFEGEMTVTTDADPNDGYWIGLWVEGAYQGPFQVFEAEMAWSWSDFTPFATCETQDFSVSLFDPSYSPFDEELSPIDAIDGFTFAYGPDPECDSGGPAGAGGNELGMTGLGLASPGGIAAFALVTALAGGALSASRRRRI